jgi:putative ABC transport system permease protein
VSLRIFRRSPFLALSAVLALAMGIGFTTKMFSIVRGGTHSLPVRHPDRIVALTRIAKSGNDLGPSSFDYFAWSRAQRSYAGLRAFEERSMTLGGDDVHPAPRSGKSLPHEPLGLTRAQGRT